MRPYIGDYWPCSKWCKPRFEFDPSDRKKKWWNDRPLEPPIDQGPHICDKCSMEFDSEIDLVKHHNATHFRPFTCDICKDTFFSKNKLNKHQIQHHPVEAPFKYHCSFCSKGFFSQKHRDDHLKQHGSGFKCNDCQKYFATKQSLINHKATEMHKQMMISKYGTGEESDSSDL